MSNSKMNLLVAVDFLLHNVPLRSEEVLPLPQMTFDTEARQAATANAQPIVDNTTGEEILQLPVMNFKPASKSASRQAERDDEEVLALPSTL